MIINVGGYEDLSKNSEMAYLCTTTQSFGFLFLQLDSQIIKVVQQVVSQAQGGQQIIVRNVEANEKPGIFDTGDTITIATPESLTEQVAITLASAISNGALLSTASSTEGTTAMEQDEHYVIASSDEMEIQTVVVV